MTEALMTKLTILAIVLLVFIAGTPTLTGQVTAVPLRSRLCPTGYISIVSSHVGIGGPSTQIVECRPARIIEQTGPQFDTAYRAQRFQKYDRFKPPAYHQRVR